MIDEPLDRCVCTGLAGFLFEGETGESRTVAVGCSTCGIRTESFPLNQADDAVLAWEAGDFAEGVPAVTGENGQSRSGSVSRGRLRGLTPVNLRG